MCPLFPWLSVNESIEALRQLVSMGSWRMTRKAAIVFGLVDIYPAIRAAGELIVEVCAATATFKLVSGRWGIDACRHAIYRIYPSHSDLIEMLQVEAAQATTLRRANHLFTVNPFFETNNSAYLSL